MGAEIYLDKFIKYSWEDRLKIVTMRMRNGVFLRSVLDREIRHTNYDRIPLRMRNDIWMTYMRNMAQLAYVPFETIFAVLVHDLSARGATCLSPIRQGCCTTFDHSSFHSAPGRAEVLHIGLHYTTNY